MCPCVQMDLVMLLLWASDLLWSLPCATCFLACVYVYSLPFVFFSISIFCLCFHSVSMLLCPLFAQMTIFRQRKIRWFLSVLFCRHLSGKNNSTWEPSEPGVPLFGMGNSVLVISLYVIRPYNFLRVSSPLSWRCCCTSFSNIFIFKPSTHRPIYICTQG